MNAWCPVKELPALLVEEFLEPALMPEPPEDFGGGAWD
jgi:hypothetical protein